MGADDLELAKRFLSALATAARTGDREPIYPLLAADVDWITPKRDLHGIDEAHDRLTWISPPEHLEIEFSDPNLTDLGDGRVVSEVHEVYRVKGTGDFAYARDRRIDLTIRDGKIARYEMRIVG
jgi:ketosteroid isomerase-like protein